MQRYTPPIEQFRTYKAVDNNQPFKNTHRSAVFFSDVIACTLPALDNIYAIILWLSPGKWVFKSHMVRCSHSQWPHFYHTASKDRPLLEKTISSYISPLQQHPSMNNAQLQQYAHHKATTSFVFSTVTNFIPILPTTYYNIASALTYLGQVCAHLFMHLTALELRQLT